MKRCGCISSSVTATLIDQCLVFNQFNEMGIAIEPFNMKNEREGAGFIDENMNFVFSKDRADVDAWVAGMDEESMEKAIGEAALAKKKRDMEKQRIEENEEAALKVRRSPLELKQELLQMLRPYETIPVAMRRLRGKGSYSRNH